MLERIVSIVYVGGDVCSVVCACCSVLKAFAIRIIRNLEAMCVVYVALHPYKTEPFALSQMFLWPGILHCQGCSTECLKMPLG
jgi:hypothetical protein